MRIGSRLSHESCAMTPEQLTPYIVPLLLLALVLRRAGKARAVRPNIPAKHALIEMGRAGDVSSGDFDVTNFAVSKRWRHH